MERKLPTIRNAFYVRNTRKENLKCLDGLPQGCDMPRYDYEFDEDGALVSIHKLVNPDEITDK